MTSAERKSFPARDALSGISIYEGADGSCRIDLSDNTSQWGTPPSLGKMIFAQANRDFSGYPTPYGGDLKPAIAAYLGVDAESVVTGCGSDDVLDSTIRAFGDPGATLAHMDPSFGMIPVFARIAGQMPVGIPVSAGSDGFADTRARVTYLCSPNNPTGIVLSRPFIERVIERADGVVIVDEAYAEFAGASVVDLTSRFDNVIVTRTLSKAFGLAGLRIGYGIAAPAVARAVEKVRGPFKLNAIGEHAAAAALTSDIEWMRHNVAKVHANRKRFTEALRELRLSPLASEANFVLVPVTDAPGVAARMRKSGVEVRAFEGLRDIGDALRISIGPWEMMEECIAALRGAVR